MGPIHRLLHTLQDLKEADLTALVIRSGIDRQLIPGMLETLIRLGKVESIEYHNPLIQQGCTLGCCSSRNPGRVDSLPTQLETSGSICLYRLTTKGRRIVLIP